MDYSPQQEETKRKLITAMLDSFAAPNSKPANDTQLAVYTELASMHDLEDVATCTAAYRRGDVVTHTNKSFAPTPAMFGQEVRRFKADRLLLTRIAKKGQARLESPFKHKLSEDERKALVQRKVVPLKAKIEAHQEANKSAGVKGGAPKSNFIDEDWYQKSCYK